MSKLESEIRALLGHWVLDNGEENAQVVLDSISRGDKLVSETTIAKRVAAMSAPARLAYHDLQWRIAEAESKRAKANKEFQRRVLETLIRIGIAALV